jgi:Na+/H+ antiporter NhaD/arsenite permease-like protein
MEQQAIIAIIVFLICYALIISEKIHRTIIAISGAILMIGLGILNQDTAIHHIDFNTLGLLIGMMILVFITSETGAFHYVAIWSVKKVKGDPLKILIAFALITAIACNDCTLNGPHYFYHHPAS